jgi:hypothetical protein
MEMGKKGGFVVLKGWVSARELECAGQLDFCYKGYVKKVFTP